MILDELKKLMDRNDIPYSIITSFDSESVVKLGVINELHYIDLIEQLFGNFEQIKALNDSLRGQTLPHSWKQGDVRCVVCKPKDEVLVGLFYNEHRPLIESIDFGEKLSWEIDDIWE